jgi:hypothetical protein
MLHLRFGNAIRWLLFDLNTAPRIKRVSDVKDNLVWFRAMDSTIGSTTRIVRGQEFVEVPSTSRRGHSHPRRNGRIVRVIGANKKINASLPENDYARNTSVSRSEQ